MDPGIIVVIFIVVAIVICIAIHMAIYCGICGNERGCTGRPGKLFVTNKYDLVGVPFDNSKETVGVSLSDPSYQKDDIVEVM